MVRILRLRHWRVRTLSSISAILSQLPCFKGIMVLQPAQQVPCLFGGTSRRMLPGHVFGVVTDQGHLLCIGIIHFEKVLHLASPILLGPCFYYCYPAPLSQWFGEHEPADDPVSPVIIVMPFRKTGLTVPALYFGGDALHSSSGRPGLVPTLS